VTAHVRLVRERLQGIDREELRRDLMVGPDRLDPMVLASCLSAGLGDGSMVDRPGVAGRWFRDVAALCSIRRRRPPSGVVPKPR
jgi:hypothetical protein